MIRSERQQVRITRPPAQLFAQLTDYERLPSWLEPVRRARLLAREAGVAIVEVDLAESGRKVFEVVESPPDTISFHQVDEVRSIYSGRCSLSTAKPPHVTRLELSLTVTAPALRLGLRRRLRAGLRRLVAALEQPAPDDRSAGNVEPEAVPPVSEERVLRLVEHAGGELELDLGGDRWRYQVGSGWRRC